MTVPTSTYRVQLTPQFGFRNLQQILPYLQELGISHLYASPIFAARRGSDHGYDVIAPDRLNSELGSPKDFDDLLNDVKRRGMGWIQDIVPNHMAYDSENRMLMDALEYGEQSPYFQTFDVDWNHPYESMKGKILAPFLGKFFAECLEQGEIHLEYEKRGFGVRYYDLRFPLAIGTYADILSQWLGLMQKETGVESAEHKTLARIVAGFQELANLHDQREFHTQAENLKQILWRTYSDDPSLQSYMQALLDLYNGEKGKPESFTLLDQLLSRQLFRLSFWKVATEELNYRRFFNINQLISLRVEDETVFQASHTLVLRLLWQNTIDGVRVDHIDGLYDPLAYLRRLREAAPQAFVVVEKILDPQEDLPPWPIQGTTGYDFLNTVNGVLCERDHDKALEKIYFRFIDRFLQYDILVADKKRQFLGRHMAGDIDRLALSLRALSAQDRYARDITLYGLRRALVELLTFFPVYRSYVSPTTFSDADHQMIETALRRAAEASPALVLELQFIGRFLRLEYHSHATPSERSRWIDFVMRFQQLTGPLMAKGFEDTVLYIYAKLLSLNEVGGNARKLGVSPVEFHHFNKRRSSSWPQSMNTTSTHDTKRGEDARARITVLSEIPEEWGQHVRLWRRLHRRLKTSSGSTEIPDPNDEYFLYQTLVGAFPVDETPSPDFTDRIVAYMIKAVREAKVHTAWLKPDDTYEHGFETFVRTILKPSDDNQFLRDFVPFQRKVARIGLFNSLSQVTMKLTCPGTPDFFQGTELWDFSLVDPDNRRPVDFGARATLLARLSEQHARSSSQEFHHELLSRYKGGLVKLYLVRELLHLRQRYRDAFASGEYVPLTTSGEHRTRVVAYMRQHEQARILVAVPRTISSLIPGGEPPLGPEIWKDTRIDVRTDDGQPWKDCLTGALIPSGTSLDLGTLFSSFPVAVLCSEPVAAENQAA